MSWSVFVCQRQELCRGFLSHSDKNYRRGFDLLSPKTQQKIIRTIYRACRDLARVFGRDSLSYSEMVELARHYFGPSGFSLSSFVSGTIAADVVPLEALALADRAPGFLSTYDTEEKLETFFIQQPEPNPEELDIYLELLDNALMKLGMKLQEKVKQFPRDHGGRPKQLSSPDERQKVIQDVKELRGPGKKLHEIFGHVGSRYGVSASKIKQIWQDEKNRATNSSEELNSS